MNHFILKCPEGHTIAQCRCPGPKVERTGSSEDCPECVEETTVPGVVETTIYFHRSKEENYDLMRELLIPDSLRDKMIYLGYEIAVKVEIDALRGDAVATHFEGVELPTKVTL
jgi:hypothetical protein